MDVDTVEAPSEGKQHFNGAVPIKRARLDLTTTATLDAAQIRRRREAEKAYGRGRKIPCKQTIPCYLRRQDSTVIEHS